MSRVVIATLLLFCLSVAWPGCRRRTDPRETSTPDIDTPRKTEKKVRRPVEQPRLVKPPVVQRKRRHKRRRKSTLKHNLPLRFPAFVKLFRQHSHSVVNISTTQKLESPVHQDLPFLKQDPRKPRTSLGSGFIIDKMGYVLTSYHVVKKATAIEVKLFNGVEITARLVGRDAASNLALLKIPPNSQLKPVHWGNSSRVKVGEWVFAIGNPFGLSHTITKGIISAKHRTNVSLGDKSSYADYLQTDASINPGNAGGPLFNMRGAVIGVNIADKKDGKGISFAMPSNLARLVVQQLKRSGRVSRSWIGITIKEHRDGVLIKRVFPNSPASRAGLKGGDLIQRWNQHLVITAQTLRWLAGNSGVGAVVKLHVVRGGKLFRAKITLGAPPKKP